MKNKYLTIIAIIILVAGGIFLMKGSNSGTGNATQDDNQGSGNYQKVVIGIKNYNYYPNTITVKVNQPVRIYLDKSVVGCYRSFNMRDFGISKYLATEKDYIEFTPTKTGSFKFACSMGMGTGTLVVK
jgi:plastocyanin domain-containing protein